MQPFERLASERSARELQQRSGSGKQNWTKQKRKQLQPPQPHPLQLQVVPAVQKVCIVKVPRTRPPPPLPPPPPRPHGTVTATVTVTVTGNTTAISSRCCMHTCSIQGGAMRHLWQAQWIQAVLRLEVPEALEAAAEGAESADRDAPCRRHHQLLRAVV